MENPTIEQLVRRYVEIKDLMKELRAEKKEIEEVLREYAQRTGIREFEVDGKKVFFEEKLSLKVK
ncbi:MULTISPECIES: hypothetical protein [Thermotoga]|jgi:predicted RNase H-like nuclease (RuvC/YqgF family)|uniref:Mu Gam/Sipho-Gp157-like domain-containing protein n=1 Tax=Thermotoga neapolitana (strain ATCC 49049 / DSM 4359 / NBRC 107923 / NS-E) TaxID=309803 RepID=B9KB79_THENN|nr:MULTISPECIES: hypothetical protein [Thermotoga]MDK2786710.1 hypothetical protein [Thermotoga sp.]HBF11741.1 hypothetical protein [Thermotoga neapolitana]ACM22275.1 Putative uncharacterized protein [Thermotoga neapolitana DSM 4359]AJG40238.1 hypothetical protein TRQ7_01970 [Thermotoga sp. RQ7]KFZ22580.1 hypothetical protein LA10_00337 [Thermotoga neapolitana LA10]